MAETALAVHRPPFLRRLARIGHAVREAFSLRDPALARLWGGGASTSAGVTVTEDSALTIAAFFQGVGLISGHMAAMPLDHFKRDKDGGKTEMRGSKLNKLFNQQPNAEMSPFTFKQTLQAHLLTWGNAYAEIEWNNLGDPIGLWPITPDRVTVSRDSKTRDIRYLVASNGPTQRVDADNMLHVPGLGFDGLIGYSVIARARQSLGLTAASERYGATFFGNGGSFGGVLTSPDDLDDEQQKEVRAAIDRLHQGVDRAHRFLILSNGFKYDRMAIPPDDAQFLETRKFQIAEIARWLNLPLRKLKDYDREGVTASGEQNLDYLIDCLWPWIERWEDEIRRKLIPSAEWNQQFVKLNFAAILRGDLKSRYEAYAVGRQGGWLSVDDIREKEDMNPLPNGAGQIYLAPLNMIPADQFKAYIDKKLNPPQPAPVPPADVVPPTNPQAEAEAAAANARAAAAEASATAAREELDLRRAELLALRERPMIEIEAHAALQRACEAQQHAAAQFDQLAREARREADDMRTALGTAQAAREDQARVAEAAQADVAAERLAHGALEAEVVALRDSQAAAVERLIQAERARTELEGRMTAAEGAQAAALELVNEARAARTLAEQAEQTARLQQSDLHAALEAAQEALAQREIDFRAAEARAAEGHGAVLMAHRAVLADIMDRMVEREIERASRAQGSPEKMRRWIATFYEGHEEVCVKAMSKPIRALLTSVRSTEDPDRLTTSVMRHYIQDSIRQLGALLDDAQDELAPGLPALVHRWRTERAAAIADAVIQRTIDARDPREDA